MAGPRNGMGFIELFAGAGGMGLGLEAAGMEHMLSFELYEEPHSVLVHAGKEAIRLDLKDVAEACFAMTEQPDIIVGGPPCQDFSKAGLRIPGERAEMTQIFAQIICVLRPHWFMFENVPEAAKSSEYRYARGLWKRHGYGLTEVMEDASLHGVPQRRNRFFCIGRLNERDGFLKSAIVAARSKKPTVMRDILNPREYPEDKELLDRGYFFARPWSGKKDVPGGRGVLSIDETCYTLTHTTHEGPGPSYVAHPKDAIPAREALLLAPSQVARVQGFAADYDFRRKKFAYAREGLSKKAVALMIANAVPVTLAQALGKCISDRHHGHSIPTLDKGFTAFLLLPDPETGKKRSPAAVYNIRTRVNAARRMLEGRMYANIALEIQALEASDGFDALSVREQSDLRAALRLHHEYCATVPASPYAPTPQPAPDFGRTDRRKPKKLRIRRKKKGDALLPTTERKVLPLGPAKSLNLNAGGDKFERSSGIPDDIFKLLLEGYDDEA